MKQIPGLDGYWATEVGEIVSTRDGERVIKPRPDGKGYLMVTLTVRGPEGRKRHRFPVHRLVCLAFHGLPPEGRTHTRHLNGQPMDNRANNLAWGSPKQNTADAIRHGTIGKGMLAHRRKLTEEQVLSIRRRMSMGEADKDLAVEYGVSRHYPTKLAQAARWGHVG